MIETIIKYIGYTSTIGMFLYGALKFLKPFGLRMLAYNQTLSIENINHIRDVAYKGHAKVKSLIDKYKEMVYTCTEDGKCTYASKELSELFDRSPEEMLGYGWTLSIHEEDREIAVHKWKKCVVEKLPYQDSYRVKTKDGLVKVSTYADVVFEYDAIKRTWTNNILLYIGYVFIIE